MRSNLLTRHSIFTDVFGHELDRRHLGTLSPDDLTGLRSLVDRHGVVFVRNFGCEHDDLTTVARHFGELQTHPVKRITGESTTVSTIVDDAMRPPAAFPWHTDLSWLELPPRYGFLQALEIPDHGGDTMWADLGGAYQELPADLRDLIVDLCAVHGVDSSLLASVRRHQGADISRELRRRHEPVLHPLVRSHPTSGDPLLALCPMYLRSVVGFTQAESDALLRRLNSVLDDPRLSIRWSWTVGDLVVWDEAATNHKALADHAPRRRVMRRCVAGEQEVTAWSAT